MTADRPRRVGSGDRRKGGRGHQRGEEHSRDPASTVHPGGQIRHRCEPGAKHNGRAFARFGPGRYRSAPPRDPARPPKRASGRLAGHRRSPAVRGQVGPVGPEAGARRAAAARCSRVQSSPARAAVPAQYHQRWWKLARAASGPGRRAEDHHQQGHAEGSADLAGRLVDGAAHGEALGMEAGHGRGAQHREGEADAEAGDQGGGQPDAQVVRPEPDPGGVPGRARPRRPRTRPAAPLGSRTGRPGDRPARTPPPPPGDPGSRPGRPAGWSSARRWSGTGCCPAAWRRSPWRRGRWPRWPR